MAATERVVVLMTPQQKAAVAKRARAENLSLSDYMRRQALGDDEWLASLLAELRSSTAAAMEALSHAITRVEEGEVFRADSDARTYDRPLPNSRTSRPRHSRSCLAPPGMKGRLPRPDRDRRDDDGQRYPESGARYCDHERARDRFE